MIKKLQSKLKSQKGFTLIELIVVIAILGILAMLVMPSVMGFQSNANEAVAKQQFKILDQAYLAKKALGSYGSTTYDKRFDGIDTLTKSGTDDVKKLTDAFGESVSAIKVQSITAKDDSKDASLGLDKATIKVKEKTYTCTSAPDGTVTSSLVAEK